METAIEIIEKSKQTHQNWLDYFNRNPKAVMLKEYKNIGDIEHHRKYIKEYDQVIVEIKRLQKENGKLLDNLLAAGFIGAGTQIIGNKRYEQLMMAEAELKRFNLK